MVSSLGQERDRAEHRANKSVTNNKTNKGKQTKIMKWKLQITIIHRISNNASYLNIFLYEKRVSLLDACERKPFSISLPNIS